jgi:hexosaminidase
LYQDLDFVGKVDQAKNLLSSIELTDEDTKLEIPEMPEGVEVTYGGTDYEQVIDADRNILKPLVDTEVAVEFKLISATNPDETILYEVHLTVPGQYDAALSQNAKPKVLPELQQWFGHTGNFEITENSRILLDPALDESYKDMADRFAEDYLDITGNPIQVEVGQEPSAGDFYFKPSDIELEKETYDMEIGDAVTIRMSTETAAFWSTRTILQILKQNGTTIPKGLVRDYPKYKVRGFMFDVARKPVSMDYLEMWVKQMSWYKMNDLNLHLSDNSFDNTYAGFRLESDVPGLTNTDVYYKKDEFRSFLLDSKAQGVNIVPEFDTPGHSLAFVKVRPDLGRDGPNTSYLDVSNPETIEFIKSVWAEYMQEEDPVFLEDTVVNIGTDEYKGSNQEGKEAFRKYQDDLLRFIRDEMNHTPRLWGSQTENNGVTPITAENVQMYMWYVGYADAQEMYDKGYQRWRRLYRTWRGLLLGLSV